MMRFLSARATVALLALSLGAFALGQKPPAVTPSPTALAHPATQPAVVPANAPVDTMFFTTSIGSFKLLPPGPEKTRGTLDMDFEGTVMVSGLVGTTTLGPGVRLELDRPDHNRKVYFGKGHIHLDGEYRAIQFFGRNVKGSFHGVTVARLYGEFDKNMDTGYYWYASNPTKKYWGTNGMTLSVPPFKDPNADVKGKVRDVPAKKVG